MGIETQVAERTMTPVGGASLATIESLRARLLAERAASKEARDHAHKIAIKVSELQSRLDTEIEQRKKAEVAMKEVLDVLRAKGVAMEEIVIGLTSISMSSDSEEAVHPSSSKDAESENSSGEDSSKSLSVFHQDEIAVDISYMEPASYHAEAITKDEDCLPGQTENLDDEHLKKADLDLGRELVPEEKHFLINGKLEAENERTLGDGKFVVESKEVAEREEVAEQDVPTDVSEEDHTTPQGDENNTRQSPERVDNSLEKPERVDNSLEKPIISETVPSNVFNAPSHSGNGSLRLDLNEAVSSFQVGESSHANGVAPPNNHTLAVDAGSREPDSKRLLHQASFPPGRRDSGILGGGRGHLSDGKFVRGLHSRDMALLSPVLENAPGVGHNYVRSPPTALTRGGYPQERLYTSVDPLQHMQYLPSAEAPASLSRGLVSPAYASEFTRYPTQVPISDAMLSLVDDKCGKLGNILMALNLAKQHIHSEDYKTPYMEQSYEVFPGHFTGKSHRGYYEGMQQQLPNRQWRHESQGQIPIVHLPLSPRSDHEPSPFEAHDGVQRSTSSTSAHYMPGYDPYLQPKGEVHLGNGITLYTD